MSIQQVLDPHGSFRVPANLCALGIMSKAPQAGKVKTRLVPPLSGEEAAKLNACFLRDLGDSISKVSEEGAARGVAVYTPLGQEESYESTLPPDFFLLPQRGNGFGDRLLFAAQDLFAIGFESVCLINSDSPTVPAASFAEAVLELAKPGERIVLGPTEDGGYYLIGLKQPCPRLFQEIEWSTERVFHQTLQRAKEVGLKAHQLPPGFDVDDCATLKRLCDELLGDRLGSTDKVAPATRRFLREIIEREGRDRIWPM
jgi:rSAM/selenodomain-associated transferase 1